MKTILLSAAALTLLAGSAFAAMPVSGTVQSYDAVTRVIRFDNGRTVNVAQDVAVPASLSSGAYASVQLNDAGDKGILVLAR